ncbi:lamin tail domain-containing protein [Streptomyces sp. NBC_00101]|uniref:hypothetical protein n=1 Tax=Streptomyces sp. NBC_00101 TaxID=2975651 RepID=UPI00324E5E94
MKKKLAGTLLATVLVLCATSCSSGSTGEQGEAMKGEADYETYSTVEDLTVASEAAYQVKIGQEVSRECDDGGDAAGNGGEPTPGPEDSDPEDASPAPSVSPPPSGIAGGQAENADCLPMVFYQADILTEIYQGVAARGGDPVPLGKIIVGNVDTSKIDLEGASPLKPGSYVVIYGEKLTPAEHPGIKTIAQDLWTPTGGDQGIFDTDANGTTVTARSSSVKALTDDASAQRATASEKFTTSLSALKEVAGNVQKG